MERHDQAACTTALRRKPPFKGNDTYNSDIIDDISHVTQFSHKIVKQN
jgi:hypothetical protein